MYYFTHRGDTISNHLKKELLSHLLSTCMSYGIPYTVNEEKNLLRTASVFVFIRDNHILVHSNYDYEDGCVLTDNTVDYVLDNIGSFYTSIEQ